MAAVRPNRYFNDPNIGAGFSNLAAIFAPPAAADVANYANAAATKAEAQRLAQLFAEAGSFDERGQAANLWDPTSSHRALEMGDATAREKIRADNAGALARQFAQPVVLGQGETAFLPQQTVAATGLAPMFAGAAKPLSETEFKAGVLAGLPENEQRAAALSGVDLAQIVRDGRPVNVFEPDAVDMEPFINLGATAKPTNALAQLQDGTRVPAVQGADGGWVHAQTGARLPDSIQIFDMPKPQGTAEEIGLGKPTVNSINQQLLDITVAKNTAVKLRDAIASSPASQGVVGYIRGTAQNLIQTGGEIGAYFGGEVNEINKRIANGLEDVSLASSFDPNIPAIEMMANLLAFQYAKTTTGERLSNEMLRASRAALGLDSITANQADAVTRLNTAVSLIEDQEGILRKALNEGVGDGTATPTGDIPVAKTEADIQALPSGAKFIAPDGKTRTKP